MDFAAVSEIPLSCVGPLLTALLSPGVGILAAELIDTDAGPELSPILVIPIGPAPVPDAEREISPGLRVDKLDFRSIVRFFSCELA